MIRELAIYYVRCVVLFKVRFLHVIGKGTLPCTLWDRALCHLYQEGKQVYNFINTININETEYKVFKVNYSSSYCCFFVCSFGIIFCCRTFSWKSQYYRYYETRRICSSSHETGAAFTKVRHVYQILVNSLKKSNLSRDCLQKLVAIVRQLLCFCVGELLD